MKKNRKIFFLGAIAGLSLVLFFSCLPVDKVLAVNDVQINSNTNFQLNTFDTAVSTTIVASAGGQVTNFDVQSNYIDITLDNLSSVTFTTTVGGQYLKIIKQSGSNDYTVIPSCPTNTVTLTGTGATVILRLEVQTTDSCLGGVTPAPERGGTNLLLLDPKFWIITPLISPTPPVCADYMTKYIKLGVVNDPVEVRKLQTFLRDYEGFTNLSVTGTYDTATYNAVLAFQSKYTQDILTPWGFDSPTGMVNRTTIKKINEIYCKGQTTPTTVSKDCVSYSSVNDKISCLTNLITQLTQQIALIQAQQGVAPTTTIQSASAFTQNLELGSQGSQVILLQNTLKKLGFSPQSIDSTGYFGTVTLKAVQDFQVKYNIAQSGVAGYGIVGPKTRQVLNQLINQ